ncbi:MAG: Ribonuclease R [Desulfovibrio sp.]
MAKKAPSKKRGTSASSYRDEPLTPDLLTRLLKEVHKPLKIDDFLRILALPRKQKKGLESILHRLADSGTVMRLAGGGYTLASALKTVTGTLSVQRSGVGFVKVDAPGRGEVFISDHQMGQAWHGDRVAVVLFPDKRGKNRDGRIVNVLERAVTELVVRVVRNLKDGTVLCEPTDTRIRAMFLADASEYDEKPARDSLLRVRVGESKGPELWEAVITAMLGDEDDSSVQEELVKANHAIPRDFPPAALKEAAAFPAMPGEASFADRRDLSHLPFVTIDGATAKDFDDAVYVEKTKNGYTLYVAIADVAHYVRPGSALDAEAYLRGNSYYFPRSVEPMLPEALSNGLCSLNPRVPRLVMTAEIGFSSTGVPVRESFYAAHIASAARLTYDQVRDGVILDEPETRKELGANLPMLKTALTLAHVLADARKARGSLDFEIPEPECVFDEDGHIVALKPRESHFAHKLIEEFMVAANEAVARFLTDRDIPLLYRAHPAPDPDKLENLFLVLSMTGLLPPAMQMRKRGGTPPSPAQLQALLDSAKGTPHEYLVSRVALRAMMQAGYTPELEGHFGLASDCYCHFTSPIRRYADLIVHRSLKNALNAPDKTRLPGRKALKDIADHINSTERTAMEAEREMYKRMSVSLMAEHVGEEFPGVISGLTEFGIFVELDTMMAEGMVRLMDLSDDYYIYYPDKHELRGERTGRTFKLGQNVTVGVRDVSLARLEINLVFAGGAERTTERTTRGKRPSAKGKIGKDNRKRRGR